MHVGPRLASGPALVKLPAEGKQARPHRGVFGRRLPHALGVLTVLERRHPRQPHYYLPTSASAPAPNARALEPRYCATCTRPLRPLRSAGIPRSLQPRQRPPLPAPRIHHSRTHPTPGAPPIELMIRAPGWEVFRAVRVGILDLTHIGTNARSAMSKVSTANHSSAGATPDRPPRRHLHRVRDALIRSEREVPPLYAHQHVARPGVSLLALRHAA